MFKSLSQLDFIYCHKKENDEMPYSKGDLHDMLNMLCIIGVLCDIMFANRLLK